MSLNKAERYMIHRFIVAVLIMIPVVLSIDTGYKMYTNDNFPRKLYKTTADGEITDKYRTNTGKGYVVVNGKAHWVQENVMAQYSVGHKIVLTEYAGEDGWDIMRIFIFMLVCLVLIVGAFFGFIHLIELYFTWLKGK